MLIILSHWNTLDPSTQALAAQALRQVMQLREPFFEAGRVIKVDNIEIDFQEHLLHCDDELKLLISSNSPLSLLNSIFYGGGKLIPQGDNFIFSYSNDVAKVARAPAYDSAAVERKRDAAQNEKEKSLLGGIPLKHLLEFSCGGLVYFLLLMARIPGQSLHDFLEGQKNTLSEIDKINLCLAILEAFNRQVRLKGFNHADLKPGNIIVAINFSQQTFSVTLIDYGLSRMPGEVLKDKPHRAGGTPGFSAPEQFKLEGITTEASDIYALGRVFSEIFGPNSSYNTFLASMSAATPTDRPTFETVKRFFEEARRSLESLKDKENISPSVVASAACSTSTADKFELGNPGVTSVVEGGLSPIRPFFAALSLNSPPRSPPRAKRGIAAGEPPSPPKRLQRNV